MAEKEDILTKTYDLLRYIIPQLAKFPREQKFILADRIETHILQILEDLVEAYYSERSVKRPILIRVNLKLEKLRFLIRLSHDLQFFSHRQYGYLADKINEIGRMVGGWLKKV
ncbi:diversity-generating retroelement protein Avd [candidate division KSB1 bacterium]|nr:diversity-generating retroelement protein Avd [candidate division KSB1 bacterium]